MPGENISAINDKITLGSIESIQVQACNAADELKNSFLVDNKRRKLGEKWDLYGPLEYVPPIEVSVLSRKRAFFFIEPLGLYFFSPPKLFFIILIFYLSLYLYVSS